MRHRQAVAFCLLLSSVVLGNYVYADASVKPCGPPSPVLTSTEGGPDLVPPATEFQPRGWARLDLTISKNGQVIAVAVGEWHLKPDQEWFRAQILSWARQLVFKPVDLQCVYALPVRFELTGDSA